MSYFDPRVWDKTLRLATLENMKKLNRKVLVTLSFPHRTLNWEPQATELEELGSGLSSEPHWPCWVGAEHVRGAHTFLLCRKKFICKAMRQISHFASLNTFLTCEVGVILSASQGVGERNKVSTPPYESSRSSKTYAVRQLESLPSHDASALE